MNARRRCRLWAARGGLGAIEFAFVAPFLLALLLGVLDFGMAFWQKIEVANAADAGAQWGMSNTYNVDSIRSVVQAATSLSIPVANITPTNPCGCATSTGITTGYGTPPSCTACPDLTTAKTYIVVDAHVCYSTLFNWPGLTRCSGGDANCTGCSSSQISLTGQSFVLK
jgi:Flp pilus assembly protein TadG